MNSCISHRILFKSCNKVGFFIEGLSMPASSENCRGCNYDGVISRGLQVSGDFFVRCFHSNGPRHLEILGLITIPKKTWYVDTDSIKIQIAVLNMIAELSSNKRSASSIGGVIKKAPGLVWIAFSSVIGHTDVPLLKHYLDLLVSIQILFGCFLLMSITQLASKYMPQAQPPTSDLPDICHLLPPPLSPKDYLFMQYGGESSGLELDFSSVEIVFQKMQSLES